MGRDSYISFDIKFSVDMDEQEPIKDWKARLISWSNGFSLRSETKSFSLSQSITNLESYIIYNFFTNFLIVASNNVRREMNYSLLLVPLPKA